MASLQSEGVKDDMEHYTKRRAAQSIAQATESLQLKGEEYAAIDTGGIRECIACLTAYKRNAKQWCKLMSVFQFISS